MPTLPITGNRLPYTGDGNDTLALGAGSSAFFGAIGAALLRRKRRKEED
ncbi:LPXTG cell wall anchor domain-containing protein [Pseudolactococcus yaeyamensis]